MNSAVVGIDEANVSAWMGEHVGAVAPLDLRTDRRRPLESDLPRRSTPTARPSPCAVHRRVTCCPRRTTWCANTPIISALYPLGVPVAQPLGLCVDEEVNERPFYVMEFVDGAILRDRAQAEATFDEAMRGVIGDHLAADTGPTPRRRRREPPASANWRATTATSSANCVAGAPSTSRCTSRASITADSSKPSATNSSAKIPVQQRVSVVHGDYRLDNTVLDDDGRVRAILDWEICTLGDPIADLGLLMVYWAEPADATASLLGVAPTTAKGFATRDQVLQGVRVALVARPQPRRLLSSVRLLEVGLHHARGLRSLQRRRRRR